MTDSEKTINSILIDLKNVRENLFTLSQDIWNSIDHNDDEKLDEGVAFKKEFNRLLEDFEKNSQQISVLVSQFTGVTPIAENVQSTSDFENEKIIKELDKNEIHFISEDFTYKRPFAFIIEDKAFRELNSWAEIYIQFIKYMEKNHFEKLIKMADNKDFISKQGKKYYSKKSEELRKPEKITDDFFIETNLSANDFAKRIKEILDFSEIDVRKMKIYLRQDRNA